MDTSSNDTKNEKIQRIISLLSFLLTINDQEIIMLALEEAIDMLKDLDAE
jgi:hypothetical protein